MTKKNESRLAEFDFAKAEEGFDNHINNSIKGYNHLWKSVVDMSSYFVESGTNVYDLGCSSGKLIKSIAEKNKNNAPAASYWGIDLEQNFVKDFKSEDSRVNLVCGDIKLHPYSRTSFVTSIFTLQFTPVTDRLDIIRRIYDSMNPGAAFVIAEKTISSDAKIQDIMTSLYYEFKRESFTAEEILDKEKKLRYMMKPATDEDLVNLLRNSGFHRVQKFWQSYNFLAYVAIK